jgi:hypothetical protein
MPASEIEIRKILPEQQRREIGSHYANARMINPLSRVISVRHLASTIESASKKTGEYEDNKELFDLCDDLCGKAEQIISRDERSYAKSDFLIFKVLDELTPWVYRGYAQLPDWITTLKPLGDQK